MKTKSIGIYLALGLSASLTVLPSFAAESISVDTSAPTATRLPSSVMERHLPFDFAQAQALKLSQKPFRYMDMAEHQKPKSIRNAVIVYGGKRNLDVHTGAYRNNAEAHPEQRQRRVVIARPMT